MVSGFFTSPCDHCRILSGDASEIRMAENDSLGALELSERLGLEGGGGFLRLGLVHYNTAAEIDRLLQVLDER